MSYTIDGYLYFTQFRNCNEYVVEKLGREYLVGLRPYHIKELINGWKSVVGIEYNSQYNQLTFEDEEQFLLWLVRFS